VPPGILALTLKKCQDHHWAGTRLCSAAPWRRAAFRDVTPDYLCALRQAGSDQEIRQVLTNQTFSLQRAEASPFRSKNELGRIP
jgi:hypothetical protein